MMFGDISGPRPLGINNNFTFSLNGTANQITVSGSWPSYTLSFPSVLHSANNTLDDGTGIATFVNIIDSGLSVSQPVLSNGSKQLTSGQINLASASFVSGILGGTNGGTGVNNGSSTFTIGGNTAFSGAFTFNGNLVGNTNVTFPTSGTLATVGTSIPANNTFFYSFYGGV